MASLLIKNIKSLYGILSAETLLKRGAGMAEFSRIDNAWLLAEDGIIKAFGSMENFEVPAENVTDVVDAAGQMLLPTFVDSHTHIVFARSREEEFVLRIKGATYEEIAAAGGGILNSAKKLQAATEDELYEGALQRLHEVIRSGTGAIEIKSGYGLTVADELKMLRVIKRLKQVSPITIKASFLGAHAFPLEYKQNHEGYIQLILDEMLPAIAAEGLADYMDVFCDSGFFNPEETDRLLKAGWNYGLKPKIHGNELGQTGGVQVAVANNALSVDHLEFAGDEEIECLKNSSTFPVGLPNCSFFLGIPYAPARKIISAGLPMVLATDYNPGSSPSGNMRTLLTLACTQMKLTPEEAFNATTINGAAAIELSQSHGSITVGKKANFILTKKIPSLAYISYAFGSEWIDKVYINNQIFS